MSRWWRPAAAPDWLVEGLIPAGAVVGVADVEDGTPDEILAHGYDVVIHFGEREISGRPVLMTIAWRENLVPAQRPPAPFLVRFVPGVGYARCGEDAA